LNGGAMEHKAIKILHLYNDLMNLYGDWANAAAMKRELSARGHDVLIDKKSVGDKIDIDAYDFIYIGSGTERSQLACKKDLAQYKNALIERIDAGIPVLATGNSHELFGSAVTDPGGTRHEMLGLLEFETIQLNTRVTGDCACKASFIDDKLIGFINRAGGSQKGDVERPFFVEPREGADYAASPEGIRYKNLLGTYMTGPVLVRNPPLLKYFADMIEAEAVKQGDGSFASTVKQENRPPASPASDPFFEYQEKAYEVTINEMEHF